MNAAEELAAPGVFSLLSRRNRELEEAVVRRCSVTSILFWSILASLANPVGAAAQLSAGSPELVKKNLIDIGHGRHLNMVCMGDGSPVVVFEQGAFSHILHWQKVQEPVSAFTHACFYDRAGAGFSDPPGRSLTANNVADDLHNLLRAAKIADPIVLVGHSLGGAYAAHYTDKYTGEVAGLVLIDPGFTDLLDPALNPIGKKVAKEDEQEIAALQNCAELAKAQELSKNNPHGCFNVAPGRTPAEVQYLMYQFTRPYTYESAVSEAGNLTTHSNSPAEDYLEMKQASRLWGNKPVIVLTAGADPDLPKDKGYAAFWKSGHDRLAARSTRGRSLIVPKAGHFIQLDQPEQVVAAIHTVVLEIRKTSER